MESTEEDDDTMHTLKNITLSEDKSRLLRDHHLFVTSERDNATIKSELVQSLIKFLSQQEWMQKLGPFLRLQNDAEIKAMY